MKIVVAPNAFKESLSAEEAARAMARGLRRSLKNVEIIEVPVADGGDGTIAILRHALGGRTKRVRVTGPLGSTVTAELVSLRGSEQGTIAVEMSQSSGLKLVPPRQRNPMKTTTRGLGELIARAADGGAHRIIVGLGGSATVDGGAGMAQALGFGLLDQRGRPIPEGGAGLERLAKIVPPPQWTAKHARPEVIGVCDVTNRLLGREGAAAIFGPQKGATPAMIPKLEAGLANLAERIRRDLGIEVRTVAGGGAAGGLGAGLAGFLGARLEAGADFVLWTINFAEALRGADLVITGEGRLDLQTLSNKGPAAVARAARKSGVAAIAIAGEVSAALLASPKSLRSMGLVACFSLATGPMTLEECQRRAGELIENAAAQVGGILASGLED